MTVFLWSEPKETRETVDKWGPDVFQTEWMKPVPRCLVCNAVLKEGDRVFGFKQGGDGILIHANCVKLHARALMKDIAECLR